MQGYLALVIRNGSSSQILQDDSVDQPYQVY